jgi:hypothetical protein
MMSHLFQLVTSLKADWSEPAKVVEHGQSVKWGRGWGWMLNSSSGLFLVCVFSTIWRVGPPFLQARMIWKSALVHTYM